MEMTKIFKLIEDYHKELGYPNSTAASLPEIMESFRETILAMHCELTEMLDSMPWKPWRSQEEQYVDRQNLIEEFIDMIFFLGSIKELFGISILELENTFTYKLAENYRRIKDGYSEVKTSDRKND